MNAVYFVITTATTIGYGDITAGSLYTEKLFCIGLQFVGILIFSAITGNIRRLKKEPNLQDVINKRVKKVEHFIYVIDRSRPHIALGDPIYEIATSYID